MANGSDLYFTVQKLKPPRHRSWSPNWQWIVTGYRDGQLVLETGHSCESSMQVECLAWESRGYKRRETGESSAQSKV
jgi:hypothetical protein